MATHPILPLSSGHHLWNHSSCHKLCQRGHFLCSLKTSKPASCTGGFFNDYWETLISFLLHPGKIMLLSKQMVKVWTALLCRSSLTRADEDEDSTLIFSDDRQYSPLLSRCCLFCPLGHCFLRRQFTHSLRLRAQLSCTECVAASVALLTIPDFKTTTQRKSSAFSFLPYPACTTGAKKYHRIKNSELAPYLPHPITMYVCSSRLSERTTVINNVCR